MYYKDDFIEIRIGLGIKEFKSITEDTYTFVLIKMDEFDNDTIVSAFTSTSGLTTYPTDGNYKIEVIGSNILSYFVYFNINDSFIKEFISQVKDVICGCGCGCSSTDKCKEAASPFTLKRQKLFNTTFIVPNTIKPVSYGQGLATNPALYNFIQLFFNATMADKKTELGKEYFDYYIKGSNIDNSNLFNSIIAGYYYALYLYSKSSILNNTDEVFPSPIKGYNTIIDTFFDYKYIKPCLKCYVDGIDLEQMIDDAFGNLVDPISLSNQDNFSRTITVLESDLSGIGTLQEQIAEYINSLDYDKSEVDAEIWIDYIPNDPEE